MRIAAALVLVVVGSILTVAMGVDTTYGFNVNTVGYILLVVGIIGVVLSMIFWSSWAGPGYFAGGRRRRTTVVEDDV